MNRILLKSNVRLLSYVGSFLPHPSPLPLGSRWERESLRAVTILKRKDLQSANPHW